jgi:succinoglycan biosynthesis protein ExoA
VREVAVQVSHRPCALDWKPDSLMAKEEPSMKVSIVLAVRDEAAFVDNSLAAILGQDYPPEQVELIVVDGMSGDGTREVVRRVAGEHPDRSIRMLDNPARFAPNAFNRGIRAATGDLIIILGGHARVAPDYVRRCVDAHRSTGAECVGGILETLGQTYVARAIAMAQSSTFGVGGVAFRIGRLRAGRVDTVAFGCYRRTVFAEIGLFDEELVRNQDDEFNYRLTQAGGVIWLDPAIRAEYYSRASFRRLWSQYYQYGLYKVRVIQKRGAVPSLRHLVPAAFVFALLASVGLAAATGQPRFLMPAVAYAASNGLAAMLTSRRSPAVAPLVSVAFATLHLSYGVGFLAGLWRWRSAWRRTPSPNTPPLLQNPHP